MKNVKHCEGCGYPFFPVPEGKDKPLNRKGFCKVCSAPDWFEQIRKGSSRNHGKVIILHGVTQDELNRLYITAKLHHQYMRDFVHQAGFLLARNHDNDRSKQEKGNMELARRYSESIADIENAVLDMGTHFAVETLRYNGLIGKEEAPHSSVLRIIENIYSELPVDSQESFERMVKEVFLFYPTGYKQLEEDLNKYYRSASHESGSLLWNTKAYKKSLEGEESVELLDVQKTIEKWNKITEILLEIEAKKLA